MFRRLAALLFSAAVILASVALSPCTSRASCALATAARMDCCMAKSGISAPRCCSGHQQVRTATPATPERSAHDLRVAAATRVVSAGRALVDSAPMSPFRCVDPDAAPPGGTLVAQHTSLLL
jgi:hypothetical protein